MGIVKSDLKEREEMAVTDQEIRERFPCPSWAEEVEEGYVGLAFDRVEENGKHEVVLILGEVEGKVRIVYEGEREKELVVSLGWFVKWGYEEREICEKLVRVMQWANGEKSQKFAGMKEVYGKCYRSLWEVVGVRFGIEPGNVRDVELMGDDAMEELMGAVVFSKFGVEERW